MTGQALLRTTLALSVLSFFTGCAVEPPSTTSVAPAPAPSGYWHGDGVSGSPKIIVSIADQRAYFYKGKQLVGESTVSTGKPGFGTPPGYYTVFWKHADHVSSVFGDYVDDFGNVVKSNIDSRKDAKPPGAHYDGARMPFAMFFRGGYAMHQGYVPPYAASHGCIRLPQGMAEIFFNASPPGTPVIVKQEPVMPNFTMPPDATAIAPSAPVVRTTEPPPPPLRPNVVRSTVPTPTPVALRTQAPTVSRAPAPVPQRSPSPAPVRPTALRSINPSPTPVPLRSPAPMVTRAPAPTPVPMRSPAPNVSKNPPPVPIRPSTTSTVQPTATPLRSTTKKHTRSKKYRRSNAPAPSPTPAQ